MPVTAAGTCSSPARATARSSPTAGARTGSLPGSRSPTVRRPTAHSTPTAPRWSARRSAGRSRAGCSWSTTGRTPARRDRAPTSSTSTGARSPGSCLRRDPAAEYPVQVVVGEPSLRIELVAQPDEVVEAGVAGRQVGRREVVQLAPVRPAGDRADDVLHRAEVLLVWRPEVLVHRDVGGLPLGRGGEPDVVGGGH